MLANSDRPNLRARAWEVLETPGDILLSDLPDSELLELIRVAKRQRLSAVLIEAAAELVRRIGDRATDEALIRRSADMEAHLIELKENAFRPLP